MPLPRTSVETDSDGRFRVEGIFPGHAMMIEFHRGGNPAMGKRDCERAQSAQCPRALRPFALLND
jgi:hypothetical protein